MRYVLHPLHCTATTPYVLCVIHPLHCSVILCLLCSNLLNYTVIISYIIHVKDPLHGSVTTSYVFYVVHPLNYTIVSSYVRYVEHPCSVQFCYTLCALLYIHLLPLKSPLLYIC